MNIKKKYSLVIFLPTKNPSKYIIKTIKSFLNLKSKKYLLIIINNGEEIKIKNFKKIIFNKNIKYFSINNKKKKFVNYIELYPKILKKIFFKKKNYPNFFINTADDDIFLNKINLKRAISILESDKNISYIIPPIKRVTDKKKITIYNHEEKVLQGEFFLDQLFNEEYNFNFSIDKSHLSQCLHGAIFRLDKLLELKCFNTLKLYKYNLWDGFGLDFVWYLRPAFLKESKIYLMSGKPIKQYNETTKSMTSKYPIMFSFCYYNYLLNNYYYFRNNNEKFYNSQIMQPFISRWINQMFCSYFSVLTLDGIEKKESPVENYLGYKFIFYVIFQCFKFSNIKNFQILFYWLKAKFKYHIRIYIAYIKKILLNQTS